MNAVQFTIVEYVKTETLRPVAGTARRAFRYMKMHHRDISRRCSLTNLQRPPRQVCTYCSKRRWAHLEYRLDGMVRSTKTRRKRLSSNAQCMQKASTGRVQGLITDYFWKRAYRRKTVYDTNKRTIPRAGPVSRSAWLKDVEDQSKDLVRI